MKITYNNMFVPINWKVFIKNLLVNRSLDDLTPPLSDGVTLKVFRKYLCDEKHQLDLAFIHNGLVFLGIDLDNYDDCGNSLYYSLFLLTIGDNERDKIKIYFEFVETLIKYGHNPNINCTERSTQSLIFNILANWYRESLDIRDKWYHLINSLNKINYQEVDERGRNLLMGLCESTIVEGLDHILVDLCDKVDHRQLDCENANVLMYACMNEFISKENFSYIMKLNNHNHTDIYGRTPLMRAASFDSVNAVLWLLKGGVPVNAYDFDRKTALMCSSLEEIDKILTDHGADVDKVDIKGRTALMIRSHDRNISYGSTLLKKSKHLIDHTDTTGNSAFSLCCQLHKDYEQNDESFTENIIALMDAKAKINPIDLTRGFALMYDPNLTQKILLSAISHGLAMNDKFNYDNTSMMTLLDFALYNLDTYSTLIPIMVENGARTSDGNLGLQCFPDNDDPASNVFRYLNEKDKDLIIEDYEAKINLLKENHRIEKEKLLQDIYAPDGVGYFEAQKRFEINRALS